MKKENISDALNMLNGDILEETNGVRSKKKKRSWVKWGAIAACFCLIAGGAFALFGHTGSGSRKVLQWSASFQAEDYFKYNSSTSDGMSQSGSIADSAIHYAETRYFSDNRQQLEAESVIPEIDSHPLFNCVAYYNSDGSISYVRFSWHRRGESGDYSDLKITAGQQEVSLIKDTICVEIDDKGNIVEPTITVTDRDGVQIVTEGRSNQKKKITFQNESGWYQITGSWNDNYDSVVMLLDWLWAHPVDFTRFSMDAGDLCTTASLDEYPDAFSEYLPDFEAFGFIALQAHLQLKNGVPISFEGHYVAHVDEALVKANNYYDVQGYTKMHWCFKTEPDVYDLQRSVGKLDVLTEQLVRDTLAEGSSIAFTWGEYFVVIYPDSPYEAWDLIASLQS